MSATSEHLKAVEAERTRRAATPGLLPKVLAVKVFQQRRFSRTYADLLQSPRYSSAARFFLDELYGPKDFAERDAQFARVVPAVARLFPREVSETVTVLAELHALSESLDTAMAEQLEHASFDSLDYIRAWQRTGRESDRQRQIALTLGIASRLDRFTRSPLLRSGLRLMRRPAEAAGLSELQRFLEAGFDTFRAMKGAQEFICTVELRERTLAASLFSAELLVDGISISLQRALANLP